MKYFERLSTNIKNSKNRIFGTGSNDNGQLGTGDTQAVGHSPKIN